MFPPTNDRFSAFHAHRDPRPPHPQRLHTPGSRVAVNRAERRTIGPRSCEGGHHARSKNGVTGSRPDDALFRASRRRAALRRLEVRPPRRRRREIRLHQSALVRLHRRRRRRGQHANVELRDGVAQRAVAQRPDGRTLLRPARRSRSTAMRLGTKRPVARFARRSSPMAARCGTRRCTPRPTLRMPTCLPTANRSSASGR